MLNMRATDFGSALAVEAYPRPGLYNFGIKRILESLLILATAHVTLPLVLFMALLVSLDGGNPFFVQKRIGRNGRVFRIWKLRTMVPNAEDKLQSYLAQNPEARRQWDLTQKLKNDPRVTPLGRILRKTSLDELPQLLNVLNGTMALVGPRPMMVAQRHLYGGRSYYRLRPGITGLWQISARNESEFAARVYYDDLYSHTLSLWTDMRILARTVAVVLRGTGY
jgi:exopolysaccharide production protein ExoY